MLVSMPNKSSLPTHKLVNSECSTDIRSLIEQCGAVLHGHFRLASLRHSDIYVEKFRVLERPDILEAVAKPIVEQFRSQKPEVVAGPSTGGMIVAYEVARQLGIPAVYVETDENVRVLKRGGSIKAGAKVLLVDDVLTTGVSLNEVLPVISKSEGHLIGIGVLIDRSELSLDFDVPLFASSRFEATTYPDESVPDWLAKIPITTPGSRAKRSE